MKRRDPKTDPCGTPYSISLSSDMIPPGMLFYIC